MYSASSAFHEAVANGAHQIPLLLFDDAVFSSGDIDITKGIEFNDYFNTEKDLSIGQALSNEISFTLINDDGRLDNYEFGEFGATIGVQTNSANDIITDGIVARSDHYTYVGLTHTPYLMRVPRTDESSAGLQTYTGSVTVTSAANIAPTRTYTITASIPDIGDFIAYPNNKVSLTINGTPEYILTSTVSETYKNVVAVNTSRTATYIINRNSVIGYSFTYYDKSKRMDATVVAPVYNITIRDGYVYCLTKATVSATTYKIRVYRDLDGSFVEEITDEFAVAQMLKEQGKGITYINRKLDMQIEKGSIASATGKNLNTTSYKKTRARIPDYIDITNTEFSIATEGTSIQYALHFYGTGKLDDFYGWTNWVSTPNYTFPENTRYVRVVMKYSDGRELSDADLAELNNALSICPHGQHSDIQYMRVNANGSESTYEFVPLGRFIANRPNVPTVIAISFTCYDLMQKFEKNMPSASALGITYPITFGNLFAALCDYAGVPYRSNVFINSTAQITSEPEDFQNVTMREVIGWIAEAAGTNARIDRDGYITLGWLKNSTLVIDEHGYREFNPYWYATPPVANLTNRASSGEYSSEVGTSGAVQAYLIQDNPLLKGVS